MDSDVISGLISNHLDNDTVITNATLTQTSGDVCGAGSSAKIQKFVKKQKYAFNKITPGWTKDKKLDWTERFSNKNFFSVKFLNKI